MKCRKAAGIALLLATLLAGCSPSGSKFTLYRSSPTDPAMRVHIATFDAAEGEKYNAFNCNWAVDLFSEKAHESVRFWCERGEYLP